MTLDKVLNDVFLYSSYNTPLTPNSKMLVGYDGMHSGVPTLTTATLTPTTLKNIEQTFIELTSDPPTSVPHQAGFVPPFAPLSNFYQDDDNSSDSMADSVTSSTSWHTTPPPAMVSDELMTSSTQNNNNNNSTGKKRKNMGGRRPNKPSNLSPEEEEKRRVRRERNKLAAARCRRRREDHTSELLTETEGLERKKQALQTEYQTLQQKKEELEFLLDSHRAYCRIAGNPGQRSNSPLDVKPQIPNILLPAEKIKSEPLDQFDDDDGEPLAKRVMLSQSADLTTPTSLPSIINLHQRQHQLHTPMQPQKLLNQPQSSNQPIQSHKPPRPSSLKVPFQITPSDLINSAAAAAKTVHEYAGVAITTPSSGSFNFDSLMEGGTGLTPTVTGPFPLPNSSFQNRNPMDLVTPTSEQSRFVSL